MKIHLSSTGGGYLHQYMSGSLFKWPIYVHTLECPAQRSSQTSIGTSCRLHEHGVGHTWIRGPASDVGSWGVPHRVNSAPQGLAAGLGEAAPKLSMKSNVKLKHNPGCEEINAVRKEAAAHLSTIDFKPPNIWENLTAVPSATRKSPFHPPHIHCELSYHEWVKGAPCCVHAVLAFAAASRKNSPHKCWIASSAGSGPSGVSSRPEFSWTGSCRTTNVLEGQPLCRVCS